MNSFGINKPDFSEKLLPSFPGLLPLLLVLPTIWLVLLPLLDARTNVLVSVLTAAIVLTIRLAASKRVVIENGQLKLGSALVAISDVETVRILDRYEIRRLIGPDSDARTLLYYSAASKFAVYIKLVGGSAQPNCLVSTNKPEELVSALRAK